MVRSGPGSPGLKFRGRYPNYSTIQTSKNLALREILLSPDPWPLSMVPWRECLSQDVDLDPGRVTSSAWGEAELGHTLYDTLRPTWLKFVQLHWHCWELLVLYQPGQPWQLGFISLVFSKVRHWGPYCAVFLYSPARLICFTCNRNIFFSWPSLTW